MPEPGCVESSENVPLVHVPVTTEPEVTTKSLGISIVPIVACAPLAPCLIVYLFNIPSSRPEVVDSNATV